MKARKFKKFIVITVTLLFGSTSNSTPQSEKIHREIRAFSLTLYKVALVIFQSDFDKNPDAFSKSIARELTKKCFIEKSVPIIDEKKYNDFKLKNIPESVKNGGSCKIESIIVNEALVGNVNDFRVTVIGNKSTGNFTSINGE